MPTASDAEPPPVASDHQGESDGRKAWGTDQRTGVPEGGGGHHLSASAPAFVQRPKPHVVSVFNPIDYSTAQLHCNLASCMVQELRQCASAQFGIAPECFDLLHNGQLLGTDPALKAIDAGLGNGAVVVLQVKGTGPGLVMPPAPMGMMRGQLMPQHMTMYQMMGQMGMPGMPGQLFAPGSSPPLTPVGGSPAPSPLHASAGLPVQMGASIDTIPQTRHAPHHQQAPPQSGAAHPTDSLSSLPSSRSTAGRSLPPSRGASPRGAPGDGFASGEFCTYALSSDGSRSLIHALQALADPQDTVAQLLPVLRPKFANLAMHQHASKVLAALAAIASPQQVAELIRIASPDICEIAEANAGSEVLCALAARLPASDAAAAFVEAAVPRIVPLATSVNGRKVLQAALLKLSYDEACPLYLEAQRLKDAFVALCGGSPAPPAPSAVLSAAETAGAAPAAAAGRAKSAAGARQLQEDIAALQKQLREQTQQTLELIDAPATHMITVHLTYDGGVKPVDVRFKKSMDFPVFIASVGSVVTECTSRTVAFLELLVCHATSDSWEKLHSAAQLHNHAKVHVKCTGGLATPSAQKAPQLKRGQGDGAATGSDGALPKRQRSDPTATRGLFSFFRRAQG